MSAALDIKIKQDERAAEDDQHAKEADDADGGH